jgi:hypothetical protein
MISLKDASVLAVTKLRTRKVRLSVTVIISGLLFCVLSTTSFVARGAFKSLNSFSQEGLGDRFLTSATTMTNYEVASNKEVVRRAEDLQKKIIAKKKLEAKRLGIEYDDKAEPKVVDEFDGQNGKEKVVNSQTVIGQQVINDYLAKNPLPGKIDLDKLSRSYNPSNFFEITPINMPVSASSGVSSSLQVLKGGEERFEQSQQPQDPYSATGLSSFTSSWNMADPSLLSPFLLQGSSLAIGKDGRLPVLAPYTAAEELLGLRPLPSTAASTEKIERIRYVREKIKDNAFSVCYRNGESVSIIQDVVATNSEIEKNKNDTTYQKPAFIRSLPTKACGNVGVKQDTRTFSEKTLASKQAQFDKIFGKEDPKSQVFNFKVVGIVPDPPSNATSGIQQLLGGILGSTIGSGWYSPTEVSKSNKIIGSIFKPTAQPNGMPHQYIVEFNSADDARGFIENGNCKLDFGTGLNGEDPMKQCVKDGKYFSITPFGSSSLALNDIKKGFSKYFKDAAIGFAVIASIIMMGTVGRIIADSRRETAVFRAIGAKRKDIAQIYIGYVMLLSGLIGLFALVIGSVIAFVANSRWTENLTVSALINFNSQDLTRKFTIFALDPRDIFILLGVILLAGLVSAFLPLLSNLRRNPIKDMRDEN